MVEGKTIQLQIWDTVFKWIYSLARTFTVRWLEVFTTGRLLCFWSTQWMIEAVSAIFSTGFRNFRQRVVSMFLCFWWGLRVIWGTRWVLSRLSRQWKVSMVLFTLRLVLSKGRVWMLCSLKLLSRCINCTLFLPNTVRWWTVSVWQWQRVLRCVHLWLYSRWVRVLCLNLLVRVDVADFSIYYWFVNNLKWVCERWTKSICSLCRGGSCSCRVRFRSVSRSRERWIVCFCSMWGRSWICWWGRNRRWLSGMSCIWVRFVIIRSSLIVFCLSWWRLRKNWGRLSCSIRGLWRSKLNDWYLFDR